VVLLSPPNRLNITLGGRSNDSDLRLTPTRSSFSQFTIALCSCKTCDEVAKLLHISEELQIVRMCIVCRRVLVNAGFQLSDDEEFVIFVADESDTDDEDDDCDYDGFADNDTDVACTVANSDDRASVEY